MKGELGEGRVGLEMIRGDLERKFAASLTHDDLIKADKAFGFFEDLEEIFFDLEETLCDDPDLITFVENEESLTQRKTVDFNGRQKTLGFPL